MVRATKESTKGPVFDLPRAPGRCLYWPYSSRYRPTLLDRHLLSTLRTGIIFALVQAQRWGDFGCGLIHDSSPSLGLVSAEDVPARCDGAEDKLRRRLSGADLACGPAAVAVTSITRLAFPPRVFDKRSTLARSVPRNNTNDMFAQDRCSTLLTIISFKHSLARVSTRLCAGRISEAPVKANPNARQLSYRRLSSGLHLSTSAGGRGSEWQNFTYQSATTEVTRLFFLSA